MSSTNNLKLNNKVKFTKTPKLSYIKSDVVFLVERVSKKLVWLRSLDDGGATWETITSLNCADLYQYQIIS